MSVEAVNVEAVNVETVNVEAVNIESLRLRAHNLLCIQGFVGKGYSPEFVANMASVIDQLEPETEVTLLTEPDVLCAACPNLSDSGCALHGDGSERGIASQDRDVLGRLGLHSGAVVTWSDIVERIRKNVAPDDLDEICGTCPWLPLGVCKAGLRNLH